MKKETDVLSQENKKKRIAAKNIIQKDKNSHKNQRRAKKEKSMGPSRNSTTSRRGELTPIVAKGVKPIKGPNSTTEKRAKSLSKRKALQERGTRTKSHEEVYVIA